MLNTKKLIVLMVGGILSFATAFLVSRLSARQVEQAPHGNAAASQPAPGSADDGPVILTGREKELDDIVRDMRQRLAGIEQQEEALDLRQRQLATASEQLRAQAEELETLRVSLVAPLARLKEVQDQLQRSRVVIANEERANFKRAAAIYETMDSARGAQILAEMCVNQQEQDVVRILYVMSERAAGKILQEMPDKGLAARLFDGIRRVREGQ